MKPAAAAHNIKSGGRGAVGRPCPGPSMIAG